MDYNVTISRQADGNFTAVCEELPDFQVEGATPEECDIAVLGSIMVSMPRELADITSAYEELRLVVRYQGIPPEDALKRNWELFLPRHVHGEL